MNTNATLLATLLIALGASLPAHGDDITLKRSVRVRHDDGTIRLRDVARLDGDYAMRFGDVQLAVFTDRTRPVEIGIQDIDIALERAGANRALYDLSGSRVIVRPYARANPKSNGPEACTPMKLEGETAPPKGQQLSDATKSSRDIKVIIDPRSVIAEDTPRGLIADRLAPLWRDIDDPVRVRIETQNADLLHVENARPTVTVTNNSNDGVFTFRVDLAGEYAGSLVATLETRSIVHRARTDLKRGERVDIEDINIRTEWMPLYRTKSLAATASLVGSNLDSAVFADAILEPTHFAPVVRRNAPVMVRSGGSGWAMTLDCIALEDGRIGDTIDVRTNQSGISARDAKSIRVVVDAAGHATLLK